MWPYIILGVIMLFAGMIIARLISDNEIKIKNLEKENQDLKEGKKHE